MLNPKILDEFAAKLSEMLAASPAKDLEKNARALLGSLLEPSLTRRAHRCVSGWLQLGT